MKRFFFFFFFFFFFWSSVDLFAGQKRLAEIQAAYLVNFIKYTSWKNIKKNEPLRVYVFAPAVFDILKESSLTSVRGQQIIFYEVQKNDVHFLDADVIFISKDMEKYVEKGIWRSFSPSTLIISDSNKTISNGGTIQLRIVDDKIRFVINLSRISGISISSNLLRMAIEVVK